VRLGSVYIEFSEDGVTRELEVPKTRAGARINLVIRQLGLGSDSKDAIEGGVWFSPTPSFIQSLKNRVKPGRVATWIALTENLFSSQALSEILKSMDTSTLPPTAEVVRIQKEIAAVQPWLDNAGTRHLCERILRKAIGSNP